MALLSSGLGSIRAQEVAAPIQSDVILTGMSQKPSAKAFETTIDFIGKPRTRVILLRNPDRIAVDLFDTVSALRDIALERNDIVSNLRHGLVAPGRYRLIFTLKRPAVPKADLVTEGGKTTLRLSIASSDRRAFDAALAGQGIGKAGEVKEAASPETPKDRDRRFKVVIDPGHGGIDTGAVGRHGTQEKDVNLRFALALRDALKASPHVDVLLTRDDDRFISLGERSEIARRAKADLFISMHADSIRYADIRGATVYTLSERASDQLSLEIADSENAADRFVDPEWKKNEPEVFDILVELMRRETDSFSQHFAASLVQEFGRHKIRLIGNPKRSAGFKVLTAPDVPSVLVEIGYLSNVDDEQLLLDESWRDDTANAIAAAVVGFLGSDAPHDATERG